MATLIRNFSQILITFLLSGTFLLGLACSKPSIHSLESATPTEGSPIIDLAQWDDSQWNWIDLKTCPREDLPLLHTYKNIPFLPPNDLSPDYLLQEPYYLYLDVSNSMTCIHTEKMIKLWDLPFNTLCNDNVVQSFQFLSMRLIEQKKVLLLFQLNEHFQLLCLELSSGKTLWRYEINKEESKSPEIVFSNQDILVLASKGEEFIDSILTINAMNGQEIWSWKEDLNYVTCFEQELLAVTENGVFVVKSLDKGETLTPSAYTFQSSPYAWSIRNKRFDKEFTVKGLFFEAIRREQAWKKDFSFLTPENELQDLTPLLSKQIPIDTTLHLFSYKWQDTLYLSYCDLLSMKELWKIPVYVLKPFSDLSFLSSSQFYSSNENSHLCLSFEDNSDGNDAEKASLFFINASNGKLEWTIHSTYHAQLETSSQGLWCRCNSSTQNSFYYFDRILMLEPAKQQIIWNQASSHGILKHNKPRLKPPNPLSASTSIYRFFNLEDSLSGYVLLNPQNGKLISVFPKTPIESINSGENSVYLTAISDKHIFIYHEKDNAIHQYDLHLQR